MLFLTFGELHDMLKEIFDQPTINKLGIRSRQKLARRVLPADMYILAVSGTYTADQIIQEKAKAQAEGRENQLEVWVRQVNDKGRATFGRFCNNDGAQDLYQKEVRLLKVKNPATNTYYTYEDSPYRLHIRNAWKSICGELSEENREILAKRVTDKILEIAEVKDNMRIRIQKLLSYPLEECLTSLTLMAATLTFFEEAYDSDDTKLLRLMFLPFDEGECGDMADVKLYEANSAASAENRLARIRPLKPLLKDYVPEEGENESTVKAAKECYLVCTDLLEQGFLVDPNILGEVNFILYLCHRVPPYHEEGGDMAQRFLQESFRYNYKEALAELDSLHNHNLIFHPRQGSSSHRGLCIYNDMENVCTSLFLSTMPKDSWDAEAYAGQGNLGNAHPGAAFELRMKALWDQANSPRPKKYLFFSEDQHKNVIDCVRILDMIKDKEAYDLLDEMEFYIRCDSEFCGPLIDTAQSHIVEKTGHYARVYLLDDDKDAAQFLLSHHPLFYPIRSFSHRTVQGTPPTLNFVVIGSDACAEWLVREAFWMMTFLPEEVNTKITILDDDAQGLYTRILTKCPGLQMDRQQQREFFGEKGEDRMEGKKPMASQTGGKNKASDHAEGINKATEQTEDKNKLLNPIEWKTMRLDTCELDTEISKLFLENAHLYFAISCGDDQRNLTMSIRIRQLLVRSTILRDMKQESQVQEAANRLYSLPPIAFHCKDSDIATLGSHLIVNKLMQGTQWFNNYNLIPFGAYNQQYTWDNLDGGLVEEYSLCVHQEYCDVPTDRSGGDAAERESKRRNALRDYYTRQYNKDSSRAVALYLPYRLFNMNSASNHRLVNASWNILDCDDYYNRKTFEHFVKDTARLQDLQKADPDIQKLAALEQLRWSRYMLTRGWQPVSPAQTKTYMSSEYSRHQLFVGKLHPAICGFEQLLEVEKELGADFQMYNIRNYQRTSLILGQAWIEKDEREREKEREKEVEERGM